MIRILIVLLMLFAAACGAVVDAAIADTSMRLEAPCIERVPGEWWATVDRPHTSPAAWARAAVVLDVPEGAGESMGLDPSLRYYRPQLVVFDEDRLDVWCGDSDVSTSAVVFLP